MIDLDGKVVVITGAGRGLGKAHALEFARRGAHVVVNDLGTGVDGTGAASEPALEVVEEIRGLGGKAIANGDDISEPEGAEKLLQAAISAGVFSPRLAISSAQCSTSIAPLACSTSAVQPSTQSPSL